MYHGSKFERNMSQILKGGKSYAQSPSRAAIKVTIDPKKLHRDEETARLLQAIDYDEETRYSYTVETTTVDNQ